MKRAYQPPACIFGSAPEDRDRDVRHLVTNADAHAVIVATRLAIVLAAARPFPFQAAQILEAFDRGIAFDVRVGSDVVSFPATHGIGRYGVSRH